MKSALLVIDVQKRFGWDKIEKLRYERRQIADGIIVELQKTRLLSRPVIFIVYAPYGDVSRYPEYKEKFQLQGDCEACTAAVGMQGFLQHRHGGTFFEPVFFKSNEDAFTNPNLARYLKDLEIKEVILTGGYTDLCVLRTAQGALTARFDVTLLANCTINSDARVLRTQEGADRWRELVTYCNSFQQVKVANLLV